MDITHNTIYNKRRQVHNLTFACSIEFKFLSKYETSHSVVSLIGKKNLLDGT